jgi:hypothetical protein
MPKGRFAKDMTGQRFGKLTVLERAPNNTAGKTPCSQWKCQCDCGATAVVRGHCLRTGHTTSCGCHGRSVGGKRTRTHGRSGEGIYIIWQKMIERCHKPDNPAYDRYGGRGIYVCDRWRESFENFLEDMGERPSLEHSIDRKENDGPYCKDNCRWATDTEQARNTRRNHYLTYNGRTMAISAWAEEIGLTTDTLNGRIYRGWDVHRALTEPLRKWPTSK